MIHRNISAIRRSRLPALCCALAAAATLTGCLRDEEKVRQLQEENARLSTEADNADKAVRDLAVRRDALKLEIPTAQPATPEDVAKSQTQANEILKGLRLQLSSLDEEIRKWESTPKPTP